MTSSFSRMEKLCVDWGLKQDPLSYAFKTLGKGDPGLGFGHRVFPPRVVSKSLALDSDFFDVCRRRVLASSVVLLI